MAPLVLSSPTKLQAVAVARATLIPAAAVDLPNIAIYSNAPMRGKVMPLESGAFAARRAHLDAVELVELPAGAMVIGPAYFALVVDGIPVAEQIARWFRSADDAFRRALEPAKTVDHGDHRVLLVARFGDRTWGHWLNDLLH